VTKDEGRAATLQWRATRLAEHGARVQQQQLVLQHLRAQQLHEARHCALCHDLATRFNVPARASGSRTSHVTRRKGQHSAHSDVEERFARRHGVFRHGVDEEVEEGGYGALVHDGHAYGLLNSQVREDSGGVALYVLGLAFQHGDEGVYAALQQRERVRQRAQ
jgi:hypothetical protein